MLDSKDLRIGNYVYTSNDLVVKSYSPEGLFNILKDVELGKIKPIPISEDWLIRFGFFIVNFNVIEASMPNKRYTIKSIKDYYGWFFCDGDTVLTNLEFVHTLQNLWFLLASQELELKT